MKTAITLFLLVFMTACATTPEDAAIEVARSEALAEAFKASRTEVTCEAACNISFGNTRDLPASITATKSRNRNDAIVDVANGSGLGSLVKGLAAFGIVDKIMDSAGDVNVTGDGNRIEQGQTTVVKTDIGQDQIQNSKGAKATAQDSGVVGDQVSPPTVVQQADPVVVTQPDPTIVNQPEPIIVTTPDPVIVDPVVIEPTVVEPTVINSGI